MSVSERLQDLRKKNGDSQEQLAEKLGVSRQAVSKWENGQGSPDSNNLINISDTYEVSIDYILKGTPLSVPPELTQQVEEPASKKISKAAFIILLLTGIPLSGVLFLSLLIFFMRLISNL